MRELRFTQYATTQDTRGSSVVTTWSDFVKKLFQPPRRGQKDGPAIVFAEIDGRRAKKNVVAVHAIGLDFDTLTEEELLSRLALIDQFEYLAHTTFSHTPEWPKIRVILPLAEPVSPEQYPDFRKRLDLLIPGSDPQTVDAARLFFLPACSPESLIEVEIEHHQGRWLSAEDLPQVSEHAPQRPEQVETWRRRLPRAGDRAIAELGKKLVAGEPLESPGQRHGSILALTFHLAKKDTQIPREALDELFRVSVSRMPGKTLDEVWTAYTGGAEWLKNEHNKIETGGKGKYSKEELTRIATQQECSPDELPDRWVIQSEGGGWVLSESGRYLGPFSKNDIDLAIKKFLPRAPVQLLEVTQTGFRFRGMSKIAQDCGSLAANVISDLTRSVSTYDPSTLTFYEAACAKRELTPYFDPQIDEWLKILAGPQYQKLVDWMSVCVDLKKLLCALYFDGPKGSGKTLFAFGMAKLWTEDSPAELAAVMDNFNEELLRCPLIIADEEIPKKYHQTVTTTLRSMLSTTSRTLKRKYKATSSLRGALRLILTANNEFLLDSRDVASAQDLDAIAQRFLYLHVPQKATEFLESLPRETKEAWGREGIARHALWLEAHHMIAEPGHRFFVEGDVSTMHRLLLTGSFWNSLVCEWLVRYLIEPSKNDNLNLGYVRRLKGRLLVNVQAMSGEGWKIYLNTREAPNTQKIGTALNTIAKKDIGREQHRWTGGKQIYYREIDLDYLFSYSQKFNLGDPEEMKKTMTFDVTGTRGKNVIDMPTKKDQPPEEVGQDEEGKSEYENAPFSESN